MPIYEFRCTDCGVTFELIDLRPASEEREPQNCTACDGRRTERRPSRVSVETTSKGYHPAHPADV